MPRIPQLYPAILSDINDNDVIVGEDIEGTGKTFKYTFRVLKEYFGANGGTGVSAIITKNDLRLTGDVTLTTGDITITSDFNFVTDANLDTLDRFKIVGDRLNILDENNNVVQFIDNNLIGFEQSIALKIVAAGDLDTMEVLVIDPTSKEVKSAPFEAREVSHSVNQIDVGTEVVVGQALALAETNVVSGVRCIAANNEYMSSPAGDYFGTDFNDLDIEVIYDNMVIEGSTNRLLDIGDYAITSGGIGLAFVLSDRIYFRLRGVDTILHTLTYTFPDGTPVSGKINIIGSIGKIDLLFNNVIIATLSETSDISNVNSNILYFNTDIDIDQFSNIDYSYIKINSHEWTSPNWRSPITTNSQGVQTTLHSDASTGAMIIKTN